MLPLFPGDDGQPSCSGTRDFGFALQQSAAGKIIAAEGERCDTSLPA